MPSYFLASIFALAVINIFLRSAPFLLPRKYLQNAFIKYLGKTLPAAIMTSLVFFCLHENFGDQKKTIAFIIAMALVVAVHLWQRNVLASIVSGTICYMLILGYS